MVTQKQITQETVNEWYKTFRIESKKNGVNLTHAAWQQYKHIITYAAASKKNERVVPQLRKRYPELHYDREMEQAVQRDYPAFRRATRENNPEELLFDDDMRFLYQVMRLNPTNREQADQEVMKLRTPLDLQLEPFFVEARKEKAAYLAKGGVPELWDFYFAVIEEGSEAPEDLLRMGQTVDHQIPQRYIDQFKAAKLEFIAGLKGIDRELYKAEEKRISTGPFAQYVTIR